MDTTSYKTRSMKASEVERDWHLVDADGLTVGRLAARIAHILRGKHKPTYTPHVDTGDFVVVINAAKARFTGQKEVQKEYYRYSGYPGGGRTRSPEQMRNRKPRFIIEHAVQGMLPKGPLGREMAKKLKVYAGSDHPHQAQQPSTLKVEA